MSDDLTKRMSHNDQDNDKQRIEKRLDMLIGMVEILGADLQSVKSDLQNVKADLQNVKTDLQNVKSDLQKVTIRLEALEKTVDERLYDTRPIWERALAEIAGVRSEFDGLRSEFDGLRSEVAGLRTETGELRSEVAELRAEMREGFYNFGTKIELLLRDMFSLRTDHERLSRRVDDLTPKTT